MLAQPGSVGKKAAGARDSLYCIFGYGKINAWRARGARARVSVNFRIFSPCMARARRVRAGLPVYPPSRTQAQPSRTGRGRRGERDRPWAPTGSRALAKATSSTSSCLVVRLRKRNRAELEEAVTVNATDHGRQRTVVRSQEQPKYGNMVPAIRVPVPVSSYRSPSRMLT